MNQTLADMPFERLIRENAELAKLRRQYESQPAEERRLAALWQYDSSFASQLFNSVISQTVGGSDFAQYSDEESYTGAVLALAIDPHCPQALLTVGSVEYQLGRQNEAMQLFMNLTALPAADEELPEIIDKAGDFLIDEKDYANAEILYDASVQRYPNIALYHDGLSYCLSKLDKLDRALECVRRAVDLEPDNHIFLNNLGWFLVEIKIYDEAEDILKKAAALAPPDYKLARNNLAELRRRIKQNNKSEKHK